MSSLAKQKQEKQMNGYLLSFGVCAAAAFFIFLPFLVVDKGLFQYCGDFNSQQIPFYTYMNGFVKNSAGQWSWETDLGTSAVNSYSFYLYGSPFFWLTTLLPQAWVPFSMVPMFMLKFGVAGAGRVYLSEAVFRRAQLCRHRRVPVCAVRFYGLQYVFQSFCRLHRAVPVFAVGAGQLCLRRRAGRIPAGGGRQSAQQLLLFCRSDRFPVFILFHQAAHGRIQDHAGPLWTAGV